MCIRDRVKIPHPQDLPEVCSEVRKFYSDWGNVIEAANLDPKFLNREAVYKIDSLEPEYRLMLESVKEHAYQLGRTPLHGEIDPKVKQALIARCGSWRNALYQNYRIPADRGLMCCTRSV